MAKTKSVKTSGYKNERVIKLILNSYDEKIATLKKKGLDQFKEELYSQLVSDADKVLLDQTPLGVIDKFIRKSGSNSHYFRLFRETKDEIRLVEAFHLHLPANRPIPRLNTDDLKLFVNKGVGKKIYDWGVAIRVAEEERIDLYKKWWYALSAYTSTKTLLEACPEIRVQVEEVYFIESTPTQLAPLFKNLLAETKGVK